MIRVAIVDDHPAVRLGLETAVRSEPGLVPVGGAETPEEVAPLVYRTRPDVVLLDYHLPRRDGLALCREIKSRAPAPKVLLYTAFADASLLVPAIIAGADGVLDKSLPSLELFEAIRRAARGEDLIPAPDPDLLELAGRGLDSEDLPILGMLMAREPRADIARTLQLEPEELSRRVTGILGRLRAPAASGNGARRSA